jgi:hypothetical protein
VTPADVFSAAAKGSVAMQRLSIRSQMVLVAVCGLALVSLRSGSQIWAGVIATLTAQAMLLALVGLLSASPRVRGFCLGFVCFGSLQLLISFSPWSDGVRDTYWFNPAIDELQGRPIESEPYYYDRGSPFYPSTVDSRQWHAQLIAHLFLAMFVGSLGGYVTQFFKLAAQRIRTAKDLAAAA